MRLYVYLLALLGTGTAVLSNVYLLALLGTGTAVLSSDNKSRLFDLKKINVFLYKNNTVRLFSHYKSLTTF